VEISGKRVGLDPGGSRLSVPYFCINSHTAAVQKLGLDNEGLGEVLAVVGLYNQLNKLADAYQVEPDLLPKPE
jgi:hypothetical protein